MSFRGVEPFYGWLHLYDHKSDTTSPFHEVEHNLFYFDRFIYTFETHPLWDTIGSESLLLKILFVDYSRGYAIIELLGEWNDLFENDFRLLYEELILRLYPHGVTKFIFICENVFNAYLEDDDYYAECLEYLTENDGWLSLLRPRQRVLEEFRAYGIDEYFYWNPAFDELRWRKLKPWQLFELFEKSMARLLPGDR